MMQIQAGNSVQSRQGCRLRIKKLEGSLPGLTGRIFRMLKNIRDFISDCNAAGLVRKAVGSAAKLQKNDLKISAGKRNARK